MPAPFSPEEIRRVVQEVVDQMVDQNDDPSAPGNSARGRTDTTARTAIEKELERSIAVGADHGGFALKQNLCSYLESELGYRVHDCGTHSTAAVDYPQIAALVAQRVADRSESWGLVVDGAGIGSCMAANKIRGIRAALCYDLSSARNSREHNHANVLTLGSGLIGEGLARQIVTEWLSTPWGGGRHARRVALIDHLESG